MSLLLDALKEADSRHRDRAESRAGRTGESPAVVDGPLALSILEDSTSPATDAPAAPSPRPAAVDERVARRAKLRNTVAPPRQPGRRHLMSGLLVLTAVVLGGAYLWMSNQGQELEPLLASERLPELPPASEVVAAPSAVQGVIPLRLDDARATPVAPAATPLSPAPAAEPRAAPHPEPQVAVNANPGPVVVERSTPVADAALLQQAYAALRSGDLPRAEALYAQVLRTEPQQTDAHLGLATLALARGDRAAALGYYRQVLALEPEHSRAWSGLANLAGPDRLEAMESRLRSLIARQPDDSLHFALGNVLSRQSRWAEAQESYFNAFAAAPENPDYAFNLAVALDHLGQRQAAAIHYDKALQLGRRGTPAQFDAAAAGKRLALLREAAP